MENIPHFDDVKDKGGDGFVPLKIIRHTVDEFPTFQAYKDFQHKIGY